MAVSTSRAVSRRRIHTNTHLTTLLALSLLPFAAGCPAMSNTSFPFPHHMEVGLADYVPNGPNSWRVRASGAQGIYLGNCATLDGGVLYDTCIDTKPLPINGSGGVTARNGGTSGAASSEVASPSKDSLEPDTELRTDLNNGEFHYYNTLLSIDGSLSGSGGPVSGSVKVSHSKQRVVVEWARYRTQGLPKGLHFTPGPIVTGVDVGIALRLIFDVNLTTTDENVTASFGFGQIAASIASKQADVTVHFEERGTTFSFVPDNLITISSVEDYVKALNTFYTAFTYMSKTWDTYAQSGPTAPPPPAPSTPGPGAGDGAAGSAPVAAVAGDLVKVLQPPTANVFKFDIIAYYIGGLPSSSVPEQTAYSAGYLRGVGAVAVGNDCLALAKQLSDEKRDNSYVRGALEAYRSIVARGACDATKPSSTQANAAKERIPS